MAILDAEGDEDFPRAVCRAVYEHISADRVSLGLFHRRAGRFRAAYWPPMSSEDEHRLLASMGADLAQHPRFTAPRAPDRDLSVASWEDLDPEHQFFSTRLYQEYYARQGITDQLTVTFAGPEQYALGLTVDRAGGTFSQAEKDVLRVVRSRLDAVFGRVAGPHLRDVLCSVGWTRIVVDPDGEVVDCVAPGGRAAPGPGDTLTTMPWWDDVRAALEQDSILGGCAAPETQTITSAGATVIVEHSMFGDPVIYLYEADRVATPTVLAVDQLTDRQAEVARLLVDGRSAREIAAHLHITLATARSHIEHVYRRLGVRNRAQAVALLLSHHAVP